MDELIASITKMLGEGKSAADIGKAIQTGAQPVYQYAFDKGHGDATQRAKVRETELATQIGTLTTERDTVQTTLTDLQSKTPDVKAITDQFQTQIRDLNEKHKNDVTKLRGEIGTERIGRTDADLTTALVAEGVDPDYAAVMVAKSDVRSRLKFADDGRLEVMAEGGVVPLTAGEGQSPMKLLVKELSSKVPAKFMSSNGDRGTGTGAASGVGTVAGAGTQFDNIRKDVKNRLGGAKVAGVPELASRMGTGPARASA